MRGLYRGALWTALAVAVAGIAAAAALASSGVKSTGPGRSAGSGGACGVERWTVKTLQDRPQAAAGAQDDDPLPDHAAGAGLPAGHAAALRAARLHGRRRGRARPPRGRQRPAPRPPAGRQPHDRGGARALLRQSCHPGSGAARCASPGTTSGSARARESPASPSSTTTTARPGSRRTRSSCTRSSASAASRGSADHPSSRWARSGRRW